MHIPITIALSTLAFLTSCGTETSATIDSSVAVTQEFEAGCGSCIYHLDGAQGCPLAIVVEGTPMLVTGTEFNAMSAGLCLKKAQVRIAGSSDGNSFTATSVELVQ